MQNFLKQFVKYYKAFMQGAFVRRFENVFTNTAVRLVGIHRILCSESSLNVCKLSANFLQNARRETSERLWSVSMTFLKHTYERSGNYPRTLKNGLQASLLFARTVSNRSILGLLTLLTIIIYLSLTL